MAVFTDVCGADVTLRNLEVTNVIAMTDSALADTIRGDWAAAGVEKTGSGTLSIGRAGVVAYNDLPLNVREGAVVLSGGDVASTVERPDDLLARADFWLDAGTNVVQDGSGGVTTWYDPRETLSGGVWSANYNRAASGSAGPAPTVVQSPVGATKPMVYFNGCTSGTWMEFKKPDGTTRGFSSIRHIFLVANFQNTYGYVLGNHAGTIIYMHPQTYNATFGGVYALSDYSSPAFGASTFYLDGKRCPPDETNVRKGVQLLETQAGHALGGTFSRFFCAWDMASRSGGDYIGELLVYELPLTAAERLRIEAWLMAKWGITPASGRLLVTTVDGTEASFDASAGCVVAGGRGTLVKTGAATASIRSVPQVPLGGVVQVDEGQLVAEQAEVAYDFRPSETLAMARSGFNENIYLTHGEDASLAACGEATQTGDHGVLRLAGAAEGLTKLTVASKNVVLGGDAAVDELVRTGGCVYATFPDPSFEDGAAGSQWGGNKSVTKGGWTWTVPDGSAVALLTPKTDLPSSGNAWFYGLGSNPELIPYYQAPDGEKILMLKNGGCKVTTTVSVPETGDYLLSFEGTARRSYGYGRVTLTLTDDQSRCRTIARYLQEDGYGFRSYRFLIRDVAQGNYTFGIEVDNSDGSDRHAAFDDFRMRLVSRQLQDAGVVPVPNGDFEVASPVCSQREQLRAHAVENWTLTQRAGSTVGQGRDLDVALVQRTLGTYFSEGTSLHGERMLQLRGSEGRATHAAFSLPTGKYRLRVRGAKWGKSSVDYGLDGRSATLNPKLGVKVLVNGSERFDGVSSAFTSFDFKTYVFTNLLEVATGDLITLELRQTTPNTASAAAYVNVDDLDFVSVGGRNDELIVNGSFEESNAVGWTLVTNRGASGTPLAASDARVHTNSGSDANFGSTICEGPKSLLIVQIGRAEQTVHLHETGLYRLSFWTRTRYTENPDGAAGYFHAGNKLRVTLTGSDAEERELYVSQRIATTNYVRHAVVFKVTAAGDYKLALQGLNNGADVITVMKGESTTDSNVFIDNVSLRPIAEEKALPPAFPADFTLSLPDQAHLRLEYSGQLKLGQLKVGSQKLSGLIDATHPSGLVSGPGSVYVEPRGSVIIFK